MKKRILIIEDNPLACALYKSILSEDYEVLIYKNSWQAYHEVNEKNIKLHLLISDKHLIDQEENGCEVLKIFCKGKFADVPKIMATSDLYDKEICDDCIYMQDYLDNCYDKNILMNIDKCAGIIEKHITT
jgi:DNA-binding NtrC family response regulator